MWININIVFQSYDTVNLPDFALVLLSYVFWMPTSCRFANGVPIAGEWWFLCFDLMFEKQAEKDTCRLSAVLLPS